MICMVHRSSYIYWHKTEFFGLSSLQVGSDMDESRPVTDFSPDESKYSVLSRDILSSETLNPNDVPESIDLTPMDLKAQLDLQNLHDMSALVPQGTLEKKALSSENSKQMIARWKIGNMDIKTVVNDALLSGRLPLAVLQLHLHRSRDLVDDKEPHDIFNEVRDIGRAIAYELFLKVNLLW